MSHPLICSCFLFFWFIMAEGHSLLSSNGLDPRTLGNALNQELPTEGPLTVVIVGPVSSTFADAISQLRPQRVMAVVSRAATFQHNLRLTEPVAAVIFLGDDPKNELEDLLPALRHSSYWTPAFTILVLASPPEPSTASALGVLLAWSGVQRAVSVAWGGAERNVVRSLLRLRPPHPETRGFVMLSCAPELTAPEGMIHTKSYRPHYPSQYMGQLFAQRIASLRGAPCLPYFNKPFGERLANGSFNGYVADMEAGTVLFVASIALRISEVEPVVQYMYPLQKDDFCAIVRSPEPLSFLDSVEIVYTPDVWIGLASALLSFAAVQWLRTRDLIYVVFETFRTTVTGGFLTSAHIPALWLLLTLCGVVLVNAFTGGLTSYLAVPRMAHSIQSLEQVDAAADKIFLYPEYMKRFDNLNPSDDVAKLISKFVATRNESAWKAARASLVRGERFALLLPESHFRMMVLLPTYRRPETGTSLLHRVPQCLLRDAYKSFCLPRGSPLLRTLDLLQLRALQAGLYQKYENDAMRNYLTANGAPPTSAESTAAGAQTTGPYALAARHLRGAFFALVWAQSGAVVVFVGELLAIVVTRKIRLCFRERMGRR